MKHTPLFNQHKALGAKLVDFAGWAMPLQYSSVVAEYHAVRSTAGVFDVSHMGRLRVRGPQALSFLERLTTNAMAEIAPKQSRYSMVCNRQGGIKDDVFVYRLGPDDFMVCVNASTREKMASWFDEQAGFMDGLEIVDASDEVAQLAIQGPAARSILEKIGVGELDTLKPRGCLETSFLGISCLISRTGYTGEPGYELYFLAAEAPRLWDALFESGEAEYLKPAGLGARDLLRLEMGFYLYGNDISEETTPLEAGARWMVNFDKGDFIGRDALLRQQKEGVDRRLIAFELLEKSVPRHGFAVLSNGRGEAGSRNVIGEVTSGNFSPLLQKGIGLAYVSSDNSDFGTTIMIDIRGRHVPAVIVKPPFYKKKKA